MIIVNFSQYSRYRSVLKRVQGCENHWMHNSLIVSLGGFTTPTRKTYVLFCREIFDYAELEEHPYLCNHLGKIKIFGYFNREHEFLMIIFRDFSSKIERTTKKKKEDQTSRISRICQFGIIRLHFSLSVNSFNKGINIRDFFSTKKKK